MPGLLDYLFQQQQPQAATDDIGMLAPPQASGGGLFGQAFGGDYDLGSRLMMAGAFLDDNSGAAMQMAQQMERRKIAKDVAKRRYEAAREILSKRKDLVPLYNADPEQFMTYYMKMTFDEQVNKQADEREQQRHVRDRAEQLQDEIKKYAHQDQSQLQGHKYQLEESEAAARNQLEKSKDLARFQQNIDPQFQAHRGLMDAIAARAKQIQAPGAGQAPNALDLSTLGARQVMQDPKLSQTEAAQLMMAQDPSTAINQITDNRNAALSAPMREFQILQQQDPTLTWEKYMSLKGGAGGGMRMTEAERRGKALQSSVAHAHDFSDDDMKALADNSVKIRMRDSGLPGLNELVQHYVSPSAQKADIKLRTLINTYVLSVSGSAFSPGEIASRIENMIPHSGDAPQTVAMKKQLIQDMVSTIDQAAQSGTTVPPVGVAGQFAVPKAVPGKPLPDMPNKPSPSSGFSTQENDLLKKYGIGQ